MRKSILTYELRAICARMDSDKFQEKRKSNQNKNYSESVSELVIVEDKVPSHNYSIQENYTILDQIMELIVK